MSTYATWTVIFEDKNIIKNNGAEKGTGYIIEDDSFWNQEKFSNIWAIQYGTSNSSDEVEYIDGSPNSSFSDANLGDIQVFIDKWNEAHQEHTQ